MLLAHVGDEYILGMWEILGRRTRRVHEATPKDASAATTGVKCSGGERKG